MIDQREEDMVQWDQDQSEGEKAKNFKGSIKKLFIYLAKYKFAFLFVIIFAIGSTIFSIIGPTILGNATTSIYNGLMSKISGGSGIDFGELGGILLTLGSLYVTSAVFSFIQGFITSGISQKMTLSYEKRDLRKD